ncbi:pyridoxal-phosphate dependent enzyme [Oerskovia sp. M15]
MKGAVDKADEIAAEREGAVLARQFANQANLAIHRATTAEEIWADTDGEVDIFIAGIGTGGTISGVGQVLKERKPVSRSSQSSPRSPRSSTAEPRSAQDPGPGRELRPRDPRHERLRRGLRRQRRDRGRVLASRRQEEGLLVGISAGAAIYAALEVGKRPRTPASSSSSSSRTSASAT